MNNGIEGDVQSRMDAFRGNPQALAQRYAQDQQLIDLLALQKLKSEKDAAARQMQMQAGQGQMPTIAQQREQELMGMAKQEVAQRVGAVGQQQAQQQQKNLQQAMQGGIAQAPAPNMMPPQAMASGGIVAFADGGTTPAGRLASGIAKTVGDIGSGIASNYQEGEEKRRLREAIRQELSPISGISGAFAAQTDEQYQKAQQLERAATPMSSAESLRSILAEAKKLNQSRVTPPAQAAPAQAAPAQAQGIAQAASSPAFAQQDQSYASKEARGIAPPAALPTGDFQGDPQQISAELATISDPAERAAATAAFQRQMAAGNLAPQAQGAQQADQPISPVQAPFEDYLLSGVTSDPAAAQADAEEDWKKRYSALHQQQNELSQQGIAQLQQRMAQQPKQDPISEFLRGMSSQRTLGMALGAGGAGITAAQKANFDQQALLEDQLQKLRETGLSSQVTQATAQQGAGEARRKEAVTEREKAAAVAGPYLSQVSNAEARQLLAQAQLEARERIAAANLDEKTKADYASAVTARVAKLITEMGVRANFGDGKVEFETKKKQIEEDLAQQFKIPLATTSAPAAGPAIPPPPKDAVRLKGAK